MGDIAALVIRRLALSLVALFLVLTFIFFFMRYAGDPLLLLAGESATEEQMQVVIKQNGFDRPIIVQYADYLGGVVRGDFGDSLRYRGQPAMTVVLQRLPATLKLGGAAFVLSLLIAVPMGICAALRPGSIVDSLSRVIAVGAQSMPIFWLAILLILVFSVKLKLLPATGSGSWQHLVLPAVVLAVYTIPLTMRLLRSSLLEVLGQEYIMTARAKGVPEHTVVLRHALRNALIPVITVMGLNLGRLVTGAIVLEEVFAYPGVGRLAIESMRLTDYYVVQAFVVFVAAAVITMNLLTDIVYGLVDPRIRVG